LNSRDITASFLGPLDSLPPPARKEVLAVLHDRNAVSKQRVWLVHRLAREGFGAHDIAAFIAEHNRWSDYDANITARNVAFLLRSSGRSSEFSVGGGGAPPTKGSTWQPSRDPRSQGWKNLMLRLDPLNRDFVESAGEVVERMGRTYRWGKFLYLNPASIPLFRTVEDHALFGTVLMVVDIDEESDPPDLERAWRVTRRLMEVHRWKWVKFSGRRGFHLVDRIRGTLDDARLVAEDLCSSVDMEGLAPDLSLFTRRHLIRAFSVHEVSGLCSVPVSPGDTLDGIMERAKRPAGGGKGGPAPAPSTS